MGRFANSLELAKSSVAVLKSDKELAAVPVLSAGASVVVLAAFSGTAYFTLDQVEQAGQSELSATPLTYVVGVVGYLFLSVVVTFFSAVLVSGAYQRLRGGDPSLGSAFRQAGKQIGPIVGWGLLTGTVGLILNALKERAGFIGQMVVSLVGMAWDILTWLAVPVVVVEGVGPISALKRSAGLFKKTWGENLIAQIGFGLLGFLLIVPGLLVAGAVGVAIPIVGIALGALWVIGVSIVLATLNGIYRTALYLYASGTPITGYFTEEQLAAAFAPRKHRL